MTPIGWDPPAWPVVVAGLVLLIAWIATNPPRRDAPLRGGLRIAAAALLALALLDVGCHAAAGAPESRLRVLLDTSLSMAVGEPDGETRAERARAFLESDAFGEWSAGWDVEVDSFGGATTDPGGAVAAAAADLPGAVLILSDGRATAGHDVEPPGVPLWASSPEPVRLADAAIVGLEIEARDDEPDRAVVEVAAGGGLAVETGLEVVVTIDGREVGRAAVGALAAGERRVVRRPMPAARPADGPDAVVTARLEPARDPVPDNDRRSLIRRDPDEPRRALVVGLAPGWEMAPWRRALIDAHPGPVDAVWTATPGSVRPIDGGPARGWTAFDPARYRSVHLIGDPARLGESGRRWVEAFAGLGGRGVLWMPQGAAGELPASGAAVGAGDRSARPALTGAGRRWLAARGVDGTGPDGGPAWPPLERLPASGPRPPAGATTLVEAGGAPAAWVEDRGRARVAVLLGTGWYRWPIRTAASAEAPSAFWEAWSDALVRWLSAASPGELPLARLPAGGRVARGRPVEATIARAVEGAARWSVEDSTGGSVAGGEVAAPAGGETLRAGPLDPGVYRLVVESDDGRTGGGRFVVETWAPDLARTEADTAALARAARASGGALLEGLPEGRLEAPSPRPADGPAAQGPIRGLGTRPWAFLAAAILILSDWALGARGTLARPRGAG